MKKNIIILLLTAITIAIFTFSLIYFFNNKSYKVQDDDKINHSIGIKQKSLNVYSGDDRNIAVMIDNEEPAWPHSGLMDAYMVYEIIIEGGESRMMALFKNKDTSKIGPIRSARHYFVQYAMEHGAIFAHFGWSPMAEKAIKSNGVNNINGIYDDYFWRVGAGYHNAYSSISKIKDFSKNKNYLLVGSSTPKYKYSTKDIQLNGDRISGIKIKYSNLHNTSYEYDKEQKIFYRYMRGKKDIDRETKEQYFAKNIIIMYMENYLMPDKENKGRQELNNIGEGTGYYLTNGKCINITWQKDDVKSKTIWKDLDGNEITLNDGVTYVQIVPKENKVEFIYDE